MVSHIMVWVGCGELLMLVSFTFSCRLCSNAVLPSLRSLYSHRARFISQQFAWNKDFKSLSATESLLSSFYESLQPMQGLCTPIIMQLQSQKLKPIPGNCLSCSELMHNCGIDWIPFLAQSSLLLQTNSNQTANNNNNTSSTNDIIKSAMKALIMWYKNYLSPIMPPRCRFLPSCSSYGLEAIEKFGPWKGGILTAWRIFRCNPFGGTGYDPPVWPPPNYFAGSTTGKWK